MNPREPSVLDQTALQEATRPSVQVSVVIVNWNTRELLRDCLASVFSNLHGIETEVIVVDNASEDGSAAMVQEAFPKAILIRNEINAGFAKANNQAMRIARGKYVLLLNSDTLVHDRVIAASFEYMETRPDVAVLGCRVLNGDGTLQYTCSQYPSLINKVLQTTGLEKLPWPRVLGRYHMTDWLRDDERDVEVVSGCYMFVRASTIAKVGLLDEAFFFFGEEVDWCRRFSQAGYALRFAPVGCITHYGGGSAKKLSHKRDLMLGESHVRLHRKHEGAASALALWAVLFAFNASRMCFWGLVAGLTRSRAARDRAYHFRKVTREFPSTWRSTSGTRRVKQEVA